jgi:hypothetical protein
MARVYQGVGYGAGTRTTPEPNVLRVLLGEAAASTGLAGETLDLLEINIDDMNPEIYGYLVARLLAAGTARPAVHRDDRGPPSDQRCQRLTTLLAADSCDKLPNQSSLESASRPP